jgi:hypothetical protein
MNTESIFKTRTKPNPENTITFQRVPRKVSPNCAAIANLILVENSIPQNMESSKFHFREINWVIYFPGEGNEGREYTRYGVKYLNRAGKSSQPGKAINLIEVLNSPEIRDHFPHTVGYYTKSEGRGESFTPRYLQERIIRDNGEFYRFLRAVHV